MVVSAFKGLTLKQLGFDALVALVILTLGVIGTLEVGGSAPIEYSRQADTLHYALIALMALPLALRRVYPVTVLVVILGAWVIDRGLDYPDTPAAIGVFIAFYTIGAQLEARRSARIGGVSSLLALTWTAIGAASLDSVGTAAIFTTAIATATPLLLGREMHARRERVEALRIRAERAEQDREERARQAVLEERGRIARELHDVVAHQITVMTLQAEGAKRIAPDNDKRVIEALETISASGHEALAEMRRTVGLLRDEGEHPETKPLPRLSDIEQLVSHMQGAGLDVELKVVGSPKPLSDGTELAAYRIVQESLTNAARHGGPDVSTTVEVSYGEDQLDVSVTDDGRGSTSQATDGAGHGLIGMRERVAVLGGVFEAGPKSGGGYQVRASIPSQT